MASGSVDHTACIWTTTGRKLHSLEGHTDRLRTVCFSPDNNLLATGSEDRTVRIWEVESGKCLQVLAGFAERVWSVAFAPDGTLACGCEDGTIWLWEAHTARLLTTLSSGRPYEGLNIRGAIGLTEAQSQSLLALGAI